MNWQYYWMHGLVVLITGKNGRETGKAKNTPHIKNIEFHLDNFAVKHSATINAMYKRHTKQIRFNAKWQTQRHSLSKYRVCTIQHFTLSTSCLLRGERNTLRRFHILATIQHMNNFPYHLAEFFSV